MSTKCFPIESKFPCFNFPKFRFQCRNRYLDFGFDFDLFLLTKFYSYLIKKFYALIFQHFDFNVKIVSSILVSM
jgi:hypothetical protein